MVRVMVVALGASEEVLVTVMVLDPLEATHPKLVPPITAVQVADA